MQPGFLVLVEQGLVSATSFLTVIILGRTDTAELGIYYLVISLVIFGRDIQARLTAMPYAVHFSHERERLASYSGNTLFFQSSFSLLMIMGLILFLLFDSSQQNLTALIQTLLLAVPLLLIQDFIRRFALTHQQLGLVIVISAMGLVLQIGGLITLYLLHLLSAVTAFMVIAGANAAGVLVWILFKKQDFKVDLSKLRADGLKNWGFGKWALLSKFVGESAVFIVPWIITVIQGINAAGIYAACAGTAGVVNVFTGGIGRYLNANSPRIYVEQGEAGLIRFLTRYASLFVITLGLFSLLLMLWGDLAVSLLFGEEFEGFGMVAAILALHGLANGMNIIAGNGIWALGRPRANLPADITLTLSTLILTMVLIFKWDIQGVASAVLIGSSLGAVVRFMIFKAQLKELRRDGLSEVVNG